MSNNDPSRSREENQNAEDIRYVDKKIDNLKTDLNKALNKQGQDTSRLEGKVGVIEKQLNDNTLRLESKVDRVQKDLNENFNVMTQAITKLTVAQESMQDTLQTLADVRTTLDKHSIRMDNLERDKQDRLDLKKERIKATTSIVVSIVTGGLALIGVVLSLIFK